MLKESYISNIKNLPKDAIIIKVTRDSGYPLSPSQNLLNDYKSEKITWNEFVVRFKSEMNRDYLCQQQMMNIKRMAKDKEVYLVCYEKEYPCHRFVLIDIINKMKEE